MVEIPDFINEMAEFWGDFAMRMLQKVLRVIEPDRVLISEDMVFKAHSMISPAMTKEFIVPQYNKWVPIVKDRGGSVVEVAHFDILNYRNKFG